MCCNSQGMMSQLFALYILKIYRLLKYKVFKYSVINLLCACSFSANQMYLEHSTYYLWNVYTG